MPDLPTFSDAQDAADAIQQTARQLLPWLPDPPTCDECGAMLYASETFDPREAMYVASWECRECDASDVYRDPAYGERIAAGPREGGAAVREGVERIREARE